MLRAEGITDKGGVRSTNEDCFVVDEQLRLCVVADGMGGHNAGEVASSLAVEAIVGCIRGGRPGEWPFGFDPSFSEPANLVRTAIQLANEHVLETAGTSDEYSGMGTTIVAALFFDNRVAIGHVGDSRIYRYTSGRLQQMTHDDSWIASIMAKDPTVDPAVLKNHPMRNVLTNVLGARPRTDIHIAEEELGEGDVLLLTTDGVHGVLDDGQLERLLGEGSDPRAVAASIVLAAIGHGSRDNCTAVVAKYLPDE
ncbi:MAG: protein phosphatase 2C domain-containing protein [Vicinamibacterales bacterium]